MMHAAIVKSPFPDTRRDRPDEGQCAKHLDKAEREYYHRRASQEAHAAREATCREARLAHEELATAYQLLCSSNGPEVNRHPVPGPAMFQFNFRPAD